MGKFEFLELFGEIDDELIEQAGKEWDNKKKPIYRSFGMKIACAVLAVLILLGGVFRTEVGAAWERFTTKIGQMLGISEDLDKYTDYQEITMTENDITMTLEEVILTDSEILMLVSYQSDDPAKAPENVYSWGAVWIDGKPLVYQDISQGAEIVAAGEQHYVMGYNIDEDIRLGDQVEIKAVFQVNGGIDSDQELAEFEYNFTASKEALRKGTRRITLDRTVKIEGVAEFRLDTLTINGISDRITGECQAFPFDMEFALIGSDNLGNTVTFQLNYYENPKVFFIRNWDSGIAPEASSLELRLYMRKLGGEVIESEILESDGEEELVGEFSAAETVPEYEPIGKSFVVKLD